MHVPCLLGTCDSNLSLPGCNHWFNCCIDVYNHSCILAQVKGVVMSSGQLPANVNGNVYDAAVRMCGIPTVVSGGC